MIDSLCRKQKLADLFIPCVVAKIVEAPLRGASVSDSLVTILTCLTPKKVAGTI